MLPVSREGSWPPGSEPRNAMACPHCGSWSVKADRSLAGRLVCGRCGKPLGIQAANQAARSRHRRFSGGLQLQRLPWWGWLAALVAVSAALASLETPPQWEPPSRPGASHGRSFL